MLETRPGRKHTAWSPSCPRLTHQTAKSIKRTPSLSALRESPETPTPLVLAAAACALFAAFILPFLVGTSSQPVYSATYPLGAENRAATLTLAALSLVVLLWAAWRKRAPADSPQPPLRPRTLLAGAIIAGLSTLLLGLAVAHAHLRYGESAYFLERMRDMAASSGRIYTDVEFPYGPLLLLPPVWLARVGVPLPAGYFGSLILLNGLGVLMTGYVLNRLPIARSARSFLFWAFVFEQCNPLAGANYSLGKFMLPFAVLLWGISRRSPWARLLALAAGQWLTVMVSPELGVGLGAGIVSWALLTTFNQRRPADLLAVLAPIAGYLLFFAGFGTGFLDRLANASSGALNLVIEFLPHILVLLAALALLAPLAVGSRLRLAPEGPLLGGVYLLALGLLPGALGRADPLHVFFNGFGFLLLSFVGLERFGRRFVLVWTAAVALFCLQVQATNFAIYRPALHTLALSVRHASPAATLDVARLKGETGGAPIATPALMQLPVEDELALRRTGLFVPDKTPGLDEIWSPAAEQAKVDRMRAQQWALVPAESYLQAEGSPNTSRIKRLLRLSYRYPQRHPPYIVGLLLQAELSRNWVPVDRFDGSILYHRVR